MAPLGKRGNGKGGLFLMAGPTSPRVTVLMPVLNPHPVYFPQAVQSVLSQTCPDFELLIVEDPSRVSGEELLSSFQDARIRHVRNAARTSFSAQLNLGLAQARSDIVARMDADDICEPGRLQAQLEHLEANRDIMVVGSQVALIDANGAQRGFRQYPIEHHSIIDAMPIYNPLAHPATMYRKACILDAGGYQDDVFVADYELWCRLAVRGARFFNLPQALIKYRVHPQGTGSSRLKECLRSTLRVKRRYWARRVKMGARLRMLMEESALHLPGSVLSGLFWMRHLGLGSSYKGGIGT